MTLKKWILLADANPSEADQTLRALAHSFAPPAVVVARDGAEVMDCFHRRNGFQNRPDGHPAVVLLDVKMPNSGGWEVLRQMKSDARLKTIPVVIFTSSRNESDLARSYQLGANAYLVKPTQFRQLTAVLEEVRVFWIVLNELPLDGAGEGNAEPAQLATAA